LEVNRKHGSKSKAVAKMLLARDNAELRRAGVVRQAVDKYQDR
jgi:hypothetical protein